MPFVGSSDNNHTQYSKLKSTLLSKNRSSPSVSKESSKELSAPPKFYLQEDHSSVESLGELPTIKRNSQRLGSVGSADYSIDDLLKFPNESTHAYSYNPMSPNSLSVRLSILKRSLEIMIRNPAMMNETGDMKHGRSASSAVLTAYFQGSPASTPPTTPGVYPQHSTASGFPVGMSGIPPLPLLGSNVSSGAPSSSSSAVGFFGHSQPLQGLPTIPSGSSLGHLGSSLEVQAVPEGISHSALHSAAHMAHSVSAGDHLGHRSRAMSGVLSPPPAMSSRNSFYQHSNRSNDLLKRSKSDLEMLLRVLNETLDSGNSQLDKVSTLHDISLLNIDSLELTGSSDKPHLVKTIKKNLLESLAQPFYENTFVPQEANQSTWALNSLQGEKDRILHTFTSQKNTSPKAIFTCSEDHPWHFKAANDLACLTFGVGKNALRALTLLDLIHKDSRDFVLQKILATEGQELVFVGEIIGIVQPGSNGDIIWSSIWAKRKNGLLVCMFEKVPCNFMDVILDGNWEIEKVVGGESLKFTGELPKSIDKVIKETPDELVAQKINHIRYFTLDHLAYPIPCAVTAVPLEDTVKLKIHSMPYIAGVFILDNNYNLVSFNKSISKNMFGYHSSELLGKSITSIVPKFIEMISYIKMKLALGKGLVLTEHFFRKVHADLYKSSFYNSVGLDGVHKNGDTIKIDIQLRVIGTELLLWITHSRDVFFRDTTPSQLKLVNPTEIASISAGSTPHQKSTVDLPALDHKTDIKMVSEKLKMTSLAQVSTFAELSEVGETDSQTAIAPSKAPTETSTSQSPLEAISVPANLSAKIDPSDFGEESFKLDPRLLSPTPENLATPCPQISADLGSQKHVKKFSDFEVLQKMGEGAYGKVDLCEHKVKKYVVVIKMIFKERILVDTWVRDRKLGTIPSEIQIMATLNSKPHDNILQLIDFFEDDDYYYIETPMHGKSMDLFDLIELKTNMTELECKILFRQVASGIKHLHNNGIVHRDIKDENVIVDNNGFVKIIDFGSAAYVKTGPFDVFVGTIDYAAPEVLGGDPYEGKPQDVWAIGVLLYTIIYKENPFYNIDEILDGDLRIPGVPVDPDCISLIRKILNRKINSRPTIDDIYADKWLQN